MLLSHWMLLNEAHLGVKNVRHNDQNKYFMKVDDANNKDEFKARQRQNNCNLVLRDFHKERKQQVEVIPSML